MKFPIDMPVSPALVAWLETRGHQAVHALDLELGTAPDVKIMKYAMEEDRIVITADLDFGYLLARSGKTTPGVILFRGGNYSEIEMRELAGRVLESVNPDTLIDLLRKSFCHREHREKEFFSKVSVDSVARRRVTYARGLMHAIAVMDKRRIRVTRLPLKRYE